MKDEFFTCYRVRIDPKLMCLKFCAFVKLQIVPLGEPIVTVTARDRDRIAPHNVTRFSLRAGQSSARFFLVDEVTGVITLKESILDESSERYEVRWENIVFPPADYYLKQLYL